MRISVISGFEASSLFAHAINTVKMAQGFARLGHEVTIVCRQSLDGKVLSEQLAQIYGITESLKWIQLPSRIFNRHIGQNWQFSLLALPIVLRNRPDLVYARSYIFPWLSSKVGLSTVAESHAPPNTVIPPLKYLVKATNYRTFHKWVTISHRLAQYYQSLGVPQEKLLILSDAVDLKFFQRPSHLPPSPYPPNRRNIAYVGHLYDYKGIPIVLEAAALLPEVCFHFVGGWEKDIERQKQRTKNLNLGNVTFHGMKPQIEVPNFLWHADVLLLPPSQYHPSAAWTSPVKLGEYLASETPVVATDIPALRDWLTDKEVEFVQPDNPEALAISIKNLLNNQPRAESLIMMGSERAQELSYEKRAMAVIDSLSSSGSQIGKYPVNLSSL